MLRTVAAAAAVAAASAQPLPPVPPSSFNPNCPEIHTWHNVTAYRGTWKAQLASLSEHAIFIHWDCTEWKGTATFDVVGGEAVPAGQATFGFKIADGDDFDVAYSLTLVRTSEEPLNPPTGPTAPKQPAFAAGGLTAGRRAQPQFASMACSYVIAAAGPAQPDVRAEPFNRATCLWERQEGIGENYQVDFAPIPAPPPGPAPKPTPPTPPAPAPAGGGPSVGQTYCGSVAGGLIIKANLTVLADGQFSFYDDVNVVKQHYGCPSEPYTFQKGAGCDAAKSAGCGTIDASASGCLKKAATAENSTWTFVYNGPDAGTVSFEDSKYNTLEMKLC